MRITSLLLLLPLSLLAQDFEESPVLSAAAILKPEFAAGVRDEVPTYRGRNGYLIDSAAGTFEADGNLMLVRRIREIAAIARLREVSRTDEYTKALRAAAKSPLLVAKGLVEHPVSTVSGVPKGIWKTLNRAGQGLKERSEKRERSEYEDSSAAQLVGFSKAKRDVALQLGVDPYSSNEALQRELNGVSWAAFAGKLTFSLVTAPVGGGAGMALTAAGVTDTFEKAIRDQSPTDLRMASLKRLLAMDVSRPDADAFLNNTAFSPSVQTALVLHLEALNGVSNRASFVQLAAEQALGEGDALFFCETSRILAQLHNGGRKLSRLDILGSLPIALGVDRSVILALEWDYAAWTQNAAEFIADLKAAKIAGEPPTGYVVALSGDVSPRARQELEAAGVTVATRLAPGPLK
jgi:hypothetical protein